MFSVEGSGFRDPLPLPVPVPVPEEFETLRATEGTEVDSHLLPIAALSRSSVRARSPYSADLAMSAAVCPAWS